ncbi:hypothetical protein ACFQNF_10075 [Iodobacter arcticus]|uniref:Uncharacterized protein n=1 Tax=Iodobacter arcticus TaxID=590593 RepID=A0ABW2QXL6_9NEIS
MRHFFRAPLMFRASAILIVLLCGGSANAASKLYENDAEVVLQNGKPCFFVKALENHSNWQGFNINVYYRNTSSKLAWSLTSKQDTQIPKPDSARRCIGYGQRWPMSKEEQAPLNLENNVIYSAIIEAPDDTQYGGEFINRHEVSFCIQKDTQGKPTLTQINQQNGCTSEPLNTSTFWQRLFGKEYR